MIFKVQVGLYDPFQSEMMDWPTTDTSEQIIYQNT